MRKKIFSVGLADNGWATKEKKVKGILNSWLTEKVAEGCGVLGDKEL